MRLLIVAAAAACYAEPDVARCRVECAPGGDCPPGTECRLDGWCHAPGDDDDHGCAPGVTVHGAQLGGASDERFAAFDHVGTSLAVGGVYEGEADLLGLVAGTEGDETHGYVLVIGPDRTLVMGHAVTTPNLEDVEVTSVALLENGGAVAVAGNADGSFTIGGMTQSCFGAFLARIDVASETLEWIYCINIASGAESLATDVNGLLYLAGWVAGVPGFCGVTGADCGIGGETDAALLEMPPTGPVDAQPTWAFVNATPLPETFHAVDRAGPESTTMLVGGEQDIGGGDIDFIVQQINPRSPLPDYPLSAAGRQVARQVLRHGGGDTFVVGEGAVQGEVDAGGFVARLGPMEVRWTRRFGPAGAIAHAAALSADGTILVVAGRGATLDGVDIAGGGGAGFDAFVVAFAAETGEVLWERLFASELDDEAIDLAIVDAGGHEHVLAGGTFRDVMAYGFERTFFTQDDDAFLLELELTKP